MALNAKESDQKRSMGHAHKGSSIFLCTRRPGKYLLTPAEKFVKILRAKAIRLSTKFGLKSCFQVDAKDREPKELKTCYQKVTKPKWTMSKGSGSIGNTTCKSLRCLLEKYKKEQEVHP